MHGVEHPKLEEASSGAEGTGHQACLGPDVLVEYHPVVETKRYFIGKVASVGLEDDGSEVAR